jgi:hypothetical protein
MYSSINTWPRICKKVGVDPKLLPGTEGIGKKYADFTVGAYQAKLIADAVNKIDEENGNTDEPCYMPYFYRDGKGGFSFHCTNHVYWYAHSRAAAGLWFKSRAGAKFAGEVFLKIYKKLG